MINAWLATMRAIRGIQSIFAVTVFKQSPQMIGYLEKDWNPANENKYTSLSFTTSPGGPKGNSNTYDESTYCK